MTLPKQKCSIIVFIFLLFCLYCFRLCAEDKPLLAVLDLTYSGISRKNALLLVDTIIMNMLETGRFHLISRTERNNLLMAKQYPLNDIINSKFYPEIGKLLYVDYLLGGNIEVRKKSVQLSVFLYEVESQAFRSKEEREYPGFEEMIQQIREPLHDLIDKAVLKTGVTQFSARVLEQLSPVPIKEKVLFVFPNNDCTTEQAVQKEMIYFLISLLTEDSRFLPYYIEISYDMNEPPLDSFLNHAQLKNCNYFAFVKQEHESQPPSPSIVLYGEDLDEKLKVSLASPFQSEIKAYEIKKSMTDLPPLSQNIVVQELRKNLYLEEKIHELLLVEKLFSKRFSFRYHQKLLKSIYTPAIHPGLNLFSFEADVYWFYLDIIGLGIGYGFSIGYPGTLDASLNNHPPVYQHEIRFDSIIFHNIYRISSHIDSPLTYENAGYTFYMKAGINIGLLIPVSEHFLLYLDMFTPFYSLPLIPHPQDDNIRHFSLDLGGIGFNFTF
jgi:hypothetical protein